MKKIAQVLFCLCFVGSLFAVPLAIFTLGKDNTVAYTENRMLQTIPDYTSEELAHGAYSRDVELWLSDHIPLRESLMKVTTWWDLDVLRLPVVNKIVISDVLLTYKEFGTWGLDYLPAMAETAVGNHMAIVDLLDTWDGTFLYVGVPLQNSYFVDHYPSYTANRDWHIQAMTQAFQEEAQTQGLPFLNMMEVFTDLGKPDHFYAQSDHHYTYYGGYTTYRTIMNYLNTTAGLNLPTLDEEDITIEPADAPFLGSRNRELYGQWSGTEPLYVGTQTKPVPFTRYDKGQPVAPTLYSYVSDSQVTYDTYMGGDKAETWIQTNRADLPNLLIFGDSFTNLMETMIYTGFNETRSIDLRYYTEQGILSYIEAYQPDVVICLRDDQSYLLDVGNGNISY